MRTVQIQKDGRDVVWILSFKEPRDLLKEEQLKRLQPYVLNLIQNPEKFANAKEKLTITAIEGTNAAFTLDEAEGASELLTSIQAVCESRITEKLIVPQAVNEYTVHHRVMQFETRNNQIVVKYVTLAKENNFDAAMSELTKLYPNVK